MSLFVVHLKFSTRESGERELMRNAKILKLKEPGTGRIFRFRLESFHRIRLHFHANKGLEGKFPVVDVSPTTVDFGRQIAAGIVAKEKSFRHKEKIPAGVQQDFFVSSQGSRLQLGLIPVSRPVEPVVLGSHHYTELASLAYVGFSSTSPANWLLEQGQSGAKIRLAGRERAHRSLEVECRLDPHREVFT